ncbi:MAG: hypothetical protein E7D92_01965 [Anaerococcus sp.]|uniref:hypothetical protein n=1 Tax=Anaerococcus sp. TaxID=1872515 RepID=UPI0028FF81DE|nr:hypothetical protein [Anaerococcus sp.]MDU2353360.1 hypothetical protein [Anaerococcus sp.]
MKNNKNLFKILLVTNLAFLGIASPIAHADESQAQTTSQNSNFNNQVSQLKIAVDDMVNVVNSNAYYNYASQESKAEYENAINNGKYLLARLDSTNYEELRQAAIRINNAKNAIESETYRSVQKQELMKAIEDSKITINAAKTLQKRAVNFSKKNADLLERLIKESEALIAEGELMLSKI